MFFFFFLYSKSWSISYPYRLLRNLKNTLEGGVCGCGPDSFDPKWGLGQGWSMGAAWRQTVQPLGNEFRCSPCCSFFFFQKTHQKHPIEAIVGGFFWNFHVWCFLMFSEAWFILLWCRCSSSPCFTPASWAGNGVKPAPWGRRSAPSGSNCPRSQLAVALGQWLTHPVFWMKPDRMRTLPRKSLQQPSLWRSRSVSWMPREKNWSKRETWPNWSTGC